MIGVDADQTGVQTDGALEQNWGGPAIADVDGVAPPEIIAFGQVSRFVKGC